MTSRFQRVTGPAYFFNSSQLPLRENQAYHESWYYTTTRIESARCIDAQNAAKLGATKN